MCKKVCPHLGDAVNGVASGKQSIGSRGQQKIIKPKVGEDALIAGTCVEEPLKYKCALKLLAKIGNSLRCGNFVVPKAN